MRQTMAHEIDKLCISAWQNGKKKKGNEPWALLKRVAND